MSESSAPTGRSVDLAWGELPPWMERYGTYLDPETYGDKYDHHTFTKTEYKVGLWVPVYRMKDDKVRWEIRQSDQRERS